MQHTPRREAKAAEIGPRKHSDPTTSRSDRLMELLTLPLVVIMVAALVFSLLPSCGVLDTQQSPEYQQQLQRQEQAAEDFVALAEEVRQEGLEIADLVGKVADPEEALTEEDAAVLVARIASLRADYGAKAERLQALAEEASDAEQKKQELLREAGQPDWMSYLGLGLGALLAGMGIPTSGPVAPLLTWMRSLGTKGRPRPDEAAKLASMGKELEILRAVVNRAAARQATASQATADYTDGDAEKGVGGTPVL